MPNRPRLRLVTPLPSSGLPDASRGRVRNTLEAVPPAPMTFSQLLATIEQLFSACQRHEIQDDDSANSLADKVHTMVLAFFKSYRKAYPPGKAEALLDNQAIWLEKTAALVGREPKELKAMILKADRDARK